MIRDLPSKKSWTQALSPERPAIAIVLGRAGSKGVPGKNSRIIAGKPCALWSIDAARSAQRVGLIALSSDDPTLLALARSEGLLALSRSPQFATDRATVDDAAREAIDQIESRGVAIAPQTPIVILYANVPVRPHGLIDQAIHRLIDAQADSVQSYSPVGKMHPWWMVKVDEADGQVHPWQGDVLNHGIFRRQDLPPAYVPDGGVLVMTVAALRLQIRGVQSGPHAFFGRDRRGIVNAEGSVIDIDTPLDLLRAESILQGKHA